MSDLQRYGLEWKSDTDFIATPMSDGYWTPWHIAQERLTTAQAENEALRARVAELEKCLSVAHQILDDQGATGSIMGRFRKALAGDAEQTGGEQ